MFCVKLKFYYLTCKVCLKFHVFPGLQSDFCSNLSLSVTFIQNSRFFSKFLKLQVFSGFLATLSLVFEKYEQLIIMYFYFIGLYKNFHILIKVKQILKFCFQTLILCDCQATACPFGLHKMVVQLGPTFHFFTCLHTKWSGGLKTLWSWDVFAHTLVLHEFSLN